MNYIANGWVHEQFLKNLKKLMDGKKFDELMSEFELKPQNGRDYHGRFIPGHPGCKPSRRP